MSDITKCTGEGCALKETCYRFTATTGMYQSFFFEVPIRSGKCEYYWSQDATSSLRNDCGTIAPPLLQNDD